jgi:hypothetical protein
MSDTVIEESEIEGGEKTGRELSAREGTSKP